MNERHSDYGTKEQIQKGGRILLGDERGGVRKAYARNMLDVLRDNDIITDAQKDYGLTYWRMKETAFSFLSITTNPIYGDSLTPEDTACIDSPEKSVDGAMTEIWMILAGALLKRHRDVLNACCHTVIECSPLLIIQTCGENLLRQVFEELESKLPLASRQFEARINKILVSNQPIV